MSGYARSWVYEQCVGQHVNGKWRKNPGAKSVLAAVAEYADQDGRCYVGQTTLAQMTDLSERSVRQHLDFLENTAGLVEREERRRKDGTRTSDYIWILAPPERLRPQHNGDNGREDQPAKSAGSGVSTGKSRQTNRQIMSDQPAKSAGPYIEDYLEDYQEEGERAPAREENGKVAYMDGRIVQCVSLLVKTPGWPKNENDTASIVAELMKKCPNADPVKACDEFEWKFRHEHASRRPKNWPNTLRQFFNTAERNASSTKSPQGPQYKELN